jgi:hypothetical protein
MALRMRGLLSLVLMLTLLVLNFNTFSPPEGPEEGDTRQLRRPFGEDERLLSMYGEARPAVESPNARMHLSEESKNLEPQRPYPRPQTHHPNATRTTAQKLSEATPTASPLPIEGSDDIRLLIGVMSPFWASAKRQIIRNAYNRFPQNLPVDVVFVQGNMTNENPQNYDKVLKMQQAAVKWENETHGDLMLLDCVENLEDGKTYDFLSKVGREFSEVYTHVMKADDDSFINIPGTLQNLLYSSSMTTAKDSTC